MVALRTTCKQFGASFASKRARHLAGHNELVGLQNRIGVVSAPQKNFVANFWCDQTMAQRVAKTNRPSTFPRRHVASDTAPCSCDKTVGRLCFARAFHAFRALDELRQRSGRLAPRHVMSSRAPTSRSRTAAFNFASRCEEGAPPTAAKKNQHAGSRIFWQRVVHTAVASFLLEILGNWPGAEPRSGTCRRILRTKKAKSILLSSTHACRALG